MKLTKFTDVALRTLMHAALAGDRRISIDDVARTFQVPRTHVVKAVHRLGQLELLETTRGRGGGLALARPAEQISLGAVVRETEELTMLECFDPAVDTCPVTPACRLKGVLGRATEAFLAVLDETTLADLVRNRRSLAGLLDL